MSKDRFERKAYRKSPGRQYGYDYDPLRSQNGHLETSGASERLTTRGETATRGGGRSSPMLAQRPNPRRTRQLLRQSILASKTRSALPEDDTEQQASELRSPYVMPDDDQQQFDGHDDNVLYDNRYRARGNGSPQLHAPESQEYAGADTDTAEEEDKWNEFDAADPDLGYEDPLDRRMNYPEAPAVKFSPRRTQGQRQPQARTRRNAPVEYEDDEYEDDEQEQRQGRRRGKKKGLTRRKLLVGLGLAAAGGVAAYELAPRIPQALNDVGTNVEHQLQDAYNRGITAGEEAVRKEFINSLNNLEGVSLDGAMAAARLTRVAYDVFVSPVVSLAATVTGDFLNLTLRALQTGRGWLRNINYDNATLGALQTVLESWVKNVTAMPKQIQSITDADLDGAQAYLKGLKQKIQEEQAKLNAQQTTPTPKPTTKAKH